MTEWAGKEQVVAKKSYCERFREAWEKLDHGWRAETMVADSGVVECSCLRPLPGARREVVEAVHNASPAVKVAIEVLGWIMPAEKAPSPGALARYLEELTESYLRGQEWTGLVMTTQFLELDRLPEVIRCEREPGYVLVQRTPWEVLEHTDFETDRRLIKVRGRFGRIEKSRIGLG